ncbi:MAG: MBL fold metallo-hydrolase [Patescibacteria group bacterium]
MQISWRYIIGFLAILVSLTWLAVLSLPDQNLHVVACDVGQGDGILLTYKSSQVLIDSGPGNKIVDCLSRHIPFWDREIELAILTHPQLDHYGGFAQVFRRYKVDTFLANSLDSSSSAYKALKEEVAKQKLKIINPMQSMILRVGLIDIEVLSKDDEGGGVLGAFDSKIDPNEFSIITKISFADFDGLFTGDMPKYISDRIADQIKLNGYNHIEYLKVPHHGSKNGLSEGLLRSANFKIAVISAGRRNRYGHPHKDSLDLLQKYGLKIFRTDEQGDVEVVSDGKSWKVR